MARCALAPVRFASRAACCVLALLMLFLSPVSAEEPTRVEDAVVTGTYDPFPTDRSPTNASVVTRRAIEQRRPLDIPEMLGDLSGLNVLRFGSLGSLTTLQIRGSGATDVLVLQDGRPLNQPSVGLVDFATMPVDYVDRVEVVRGPYSALYGGGAMSGVVNILTRPGGDKHEVRLEGGGQGTSIVSGTLSTPLGKARLQLVPTWRTVTGERPNSRSELSNVFARLDVPEVGGGTLSLRGGLNSSSVGVPGPEPAADPALRTSSQLTLGSDLVSSTLDRQSGREAFGHLEWSQERFLVRAWTNAWTPSFHSEFADGFGGLQVSDTTTRQYSTAFEARARLPHLEKSVLTLGGTWQHDAMGYGSSTFNSAFGTSSATQFSSTRTTPSFYAEEALVLPRFQATLGLRYDRPSDFPGQLSPRVQARFEAAPWLALRGAWGRGYRAPTLLELDFPPDPFVSGNPNLLPQRSTSYELGFDAHPHRTARLRFTWFNDDVTDKIAFAPVGPPGPFGNLFVPANLNRLRTSGLEAEVDWRPTPEWRLSGTYTLLDATQTSQELVDALTGALATVQRAAANVPAHRATLGIGYRGEGGFSAQVNGTFLGTRTQYYGNFAAFPAVTYDTKTLAPAAVFDLTLAQRVRVGAVEGDLFVKLANVFNEQYALQFGSDINDRNFPMPGRTLYIGLSPRF